MIRWALPRTRFAIALASHCMVVDDECVIEANMLHGVRRVPMSEAIAGAIVVKTVDFDVPDAEAGLTWARKQVDKPYDWLGAFGMAIAPDRTWQDESDWFCFELAAAALAKAGRDIFTDHAHITGSMLMAVKP
jgi:uncharacterized protein YycO